MEENLTHLLHVNESDDSENDFLKQIPSISMMCLLLAAILSYTAMTCLMMIFCVVPQ
jgi:hypothetical protein